MGRGNGVSRQSEHVDFHGFMEGVKRRNPDQPEFVQAVQEVAEDIFEFIEGKEIYHRWQILRRLAEPDRIDVDLLKERFLVRQAVEAAPSEDRAGLHDEQVATRSPSPANSNS